MELKYKIIELFQKLDTETVVFSEAALDYVSVTLAVVMFGVALRLSIAGFKDVVLKPKAFVVSVLCQLLFLPLFTFLMCLSLSSVISQSVALGMILIAACPGGNTANFMCALARGNISLSVSMSAFSTLNCVIVTPFNFWMWGNLYLKITTPALQGAVPMVHIDFWEMMKIVLFLMGIPIVLGMLCAHYFPKISNKMIKPFNFFSIIFFFGFIFGSLYINLDVFLRYVLLLAVIVVVHNLVAYLIGYFSSRVSRLSDVDTRCITIGTGVQHTALGLILIFSLNLFNKAGGLAFTAALWGMWNIFSGMALAFYWKWKDTKKAVIDN